MMRFYLKKLLQTFLFLTCLMLLVRLLFWFRPQVYSLVYTGLILSAALVMYAVFLRRWENTSLKVAYLEKYAAKEYSFRKDYLTTYKSKENVVHTAAFSTIILLNSIRIGITAQKTPASLLIQASIVIVVFTVLNTLVWCLVHKRWHKSCSGS